MYDHIPRDGLQGIVLFVTAYKTKTYCLRSYSLPSYPCESVLRLDGCCARLTTGVEASFEFLEQGVHKLLSKHKVSLAQALFDSKHTP